MSGDQWFDIVKSVSLVLVTGLVTVLTAGVAARSERRRARLERDATAAEARRAETLGYARQAYELAGILRQNLEARVATSEFDGQGALLQSSELMGQLADIVPLINDGELRSAIDTSQSSLLVLNFADGHNEAGWVRQRRVLHAMQSAIAAHIRGEKADAADLDLLRASPFSAE